MADAVTSQTLFDGSKTTVRKYINFSDGTGESAVIKVNISDLTGTPTAVKILRVWYTIFGMSVRILFDHTTDDEVLILSGEGSFDFRDFGGIPDPASSGGAGDIVFTTVAHTANDHYVIVLEIGIT